MEKQTGDQSSYVGSVRCNKYNGEATPDINQKFIWPWFWRFECNQVTAQQTPHHPQCYLENSIMRRKVEEKKKHKKKREREAEKKERIVENQKI